VRPGLDVSPAAPLRARRPALALLLALAGLAALGSWFAFARPDGGEAAGFETAALDRGPIELTVTATGTVQPVTSVKVGTYVSGPVREIFADWNAPVKKGEIVARIDPAPFRVKVRQADANVANARAKEAKARADLALKALQVERSRSLRARDFVPQSDVDAAASAYDQAAAELELAQAGVRQAEAALEEARINLAYTDIVSPVDGIVVSRSVDVGQTVAATFQTPTLFEIAQDLTRMQVKGSVSESDIGQVREGQDAEFGVDAYPGRSFRGRVVQVRNAPVSIQNVVTYDVIVEVDNADLALKPGMTATLTVLVERREDALRVPLRALRFRPDGDGAAPPARAGDGGRDGSRAGAARNEAGPAVFVPGARGELRRVELETGLRDERYAELLHGELAAGDEVVVAYRRASEPEGGVRSPFGPPRMR
jgi:HlyD family secretion protein